MNGIDATLPLDDLSDGWLDGDLSDAGDLHLAQVAIRVHCAIEWPEGLWCNNCHAVFPCQVHVWAAEVLTRAGWSNEQITALDVRTGPWS